MNTGSRLLNIYQKLNFTPFDNQGQMVLLWAEVFGIPKKSHNTEDLVTNLVLALRAEIKLAWEMLDTQNVPHELFNSAFDRLYQISSPGLLHSTWANQQASIKHPECNITFQWVAWALRDEVEPDMPADEMQGILTDLETLEASLRDIAMEPFLKEFIQRQIECIRSALRLYKVQGITPINDALAQVFGAFGARGKQVHQARSNASDPAKGIFARMCENIKRVADATESINKIKDGGTEVITFAKDFLLPYISN